MFNFLSKVLSKVRSISLKTEKKTLDDNYARLEVYGRICSSLHVPCANNGKMLEFNGWQKELMREVRIFASDYQRFYTTSQAPLFIPHNLKWIEDLYFLFLLSLLYSDAKNERERLKEIEHKRKTGEKCFILSEDLSLNFLDIDDIFSLTPATLIVMERDFEKPLTKVYSFFKKINQMNSSVSIVNAAIINLTSLKLLNQKLGEWTNYRWSDIVVKACFDILGDKGSIIFVKDVMEKYSFILEQFSTHVQTTSWLLYAEQSDIPT